MFGEFILDIVNKSDESLITGDCNIHLNKNCNPLSKVFLAVTITAGICKCKTVMCA